MVLYFITAAALSFILLTATKHISTLRSAASSKIQEIDRSVENEINEIKLHKERMRAERMNEIHTKLAEKIRQMLRDSYLKHQPAQSVTQKSERKGHHGRPMSIGDTPVKLQALMHKNFNSFVEPANGFSGSIVENMPNSGRKFASSIKKQRVDMIGADSQAMQSMPAETTSYQVSMPSSLKKKLDHRSFQEARDNFFKLGKKSHHTYSKRRQTAFFAWSNDEQGMPSILFEYSPEVPRYQFCFFNMFTTDYMQQPNGEKVLQRTKMAGLVDQIQPESIDAPEWMNSVPVDSPEISRKKSSPTWPNPHNNGLGTLQQDSSGQTLQGDYLSPEQPSLVMSTSSPENHMRIRPSFESRPTYGFQLLKCQSQVQEPLEPRLQQTDYNRELQDEIQNDLIAYQVINGQGKLHSQSVTEPEKLSQISPMASQKKMLTVSSSASPSAVSTIRGLSSNPNTMQEYNHIYNQIINSQNAESKAKVTKPGGQIIPILDFRKIEDIRKQELESSESNHEGMTSLQKPQTFGKKNKRDDPSVTCDSKSQSRQKNSFSQGESVERGVTYRSMSQQLEANNYDHFGQCSLPAPRYHEKTISFALSMPQTPEMMSYTQSELGKTSQNLIDNQEYLFAMTNEIVLEGNEHDDETNSSKNKHDGEKNAKKPFDYTSKKTLIPQLQNRSHQSHHFQTTLESAIDHKRNQINQTVHDTSKDKDISHDNSQSLTPKDSFVYSNSTQTAAINSQGPIQSTSKTPTLFKTSPQPMTPNDQSNLLQNHHTHHQSTYIGSFLTHTDLHMTTQSHAKAPSLHSSSATMTLLTSAPPAQVPTVSSSAQAKLPSSFSLLQQKIEAVPDNDTGFSKQHPPHYGRIFKNQKSSQSGDFMTLQKCQRVPQNHRDNNAYSNKNHYKAPWSKINEYSLSAKDQQNGEGKLNQFWDSNGKEKNSQGDSASSFIPQPKSNMLMQDQRVDTIEAGKSSRQNVQSISFNISSSMQSSPRSNIVLMNKLASSSNMFPSQHSIGNSSETQAIKYSNLSPSRSLDNTDKTVNSIHVPSTINHNQGDAQLLAGQQTQQQIQQPPEPVAQAYHQPVPKLHQSPAKMTNQADKNAAILSRDLMAKVRKRKTQILRNDNQNDVEHANQKTDEPNETKTKPESTYWNTNVKDWSPVQFENFGMNDPWLYQNMQYVADYNNQINNNYCGQIASPEQQYGKFSFQRQLSSQNHKVRTPNSKLKTNYGSPNDQYKSKNLGTDDWQAVRRSAPSTSKLQQASPTPCSYSAKKQPNPSLTALTASFDVAKSAGNSPSPSQLQYSPQMNRKPSRPLSRHRKRWSDSNSGKWQIKFPVDEDAMDDGEQLRMKPAQGSTALVKDQTQSSLPQQSQQQEAVVAADACSTGETPQKKKKANNNGGPSGANGAQPGGSSSKKNKSGEKRTKRQLPPLAQRKAKGTKMSGSQQVARYSPSKSFSFTACQLTADEKNKQMQDIKASIKKKPLHLPLSSSFRHGSGFQQNQRSSSGSMSALRVNQNKGKLLEVMSNKSRIQGSGVLDVIYHNNRPKQGLYDADKSSMTFGKEEGSKRGDAGQDGSFLPTRPVVWNPSKTCNTSLRRQVRPTYDLSHGKKPLQSVSKLNLMLNQIKHHDEEEKECHSQRLSVTAPRGNRISYGVMKDKSRSGHHSVDQQIVHQSAPQIAMQRKLQVMKHKKVQQNTTTHSSSNQSDNMSTYTDDANELMELQQYFESHYARVCSRVQPSQTSSSTLNIEGKILKIIKDLGEVHYLPVQHIHSSHFLTGVKIVNCEIVGDQVVIRVGGGYQSLKDFVQSNSRNFQRQLTSSMRKSGRGITWVVDQFVQGQKHKMNAQKSAVVAPAVTSPGRNRMYALGSNHLPLTSPTSMPSVPDAKINNGGRGGFGIQQLGNQFFLNQTLRQNQSFGYPSLPSANRSNSFRLPRSPAAAGGPRLSSPLDINNPANR